MPLIVALHRDPTQWTALRGALDDLVEADVILADTIGETLDVIDARTPDLILVDPLIPPRDADHLTGYLALLPGASHVQTISIPVISPHSAGDGSPHAPGPLAWLRRWLFPSRRSRITPAVAGWRPEAFAAEVAAYLSLARAHRAHKAERDNDQAFAPAVERRQERRWSAAQACFAVRVFLTTDRADLVNISSTGLLVRTDVRPSPHLPEPEDGFSRHQMPLTLWSASGEAIRWTGTPVRCRTKSLGDGRFLYEVAFRFDEPLDLSTHSASASLVRYSGPPVRGVM
jgi:hypothetical protein